MFAASASSTPGPSSMTARRARPRSSSTLTRTRVPPGVCTSAFSSRIRRDLQEALLVRDREDGPGASTSRSCSALDRHGRELRCRRCATLVERDCFPVEVDVTGVQTGDRAARSRASPAAAPARAWSSGTRGAFPRPTPRRRATRESRRARKRRSQLVRRVRDELTAGVVELSRAGPAAFARTRVRARPPRPGRCPRPARRTSRWRCGRLRARTGGFGVRTPTRARSRPRTRAPGRRRPRSEPALDEAHVARAPSERGGQQQHRSVAPDGTATSAYRTPSRVTVERRGGEITGRR